MSHEGDEGLPSMIPQEDEVPNKKETKSGNVEAPGVKELGRENGRWGFAEAADEWEASGTALPVLPLTGRLQRVGR